MRLLVPSLLPAILAASTAVAEQSWPQFRGPRGDGTSGSRPGHPGWSGFPADGQQPLPDWEEAGNDRAPRL